MSRQGSTLHYYRGAGKEEERVEGLGVRLALHATQTDRRERQTGRQGQQMRGQRKNVSSELLHVL